MIEAQFRTWAAEIASKHSFILQEKIYAAETSAGNFRNMIWRGTWDGKPAVLKMYDDDRLTDEPVSLKAFLERNTSSILKATALYAYNMVTAKRGWLIMEHLPEGAFFTMPMPRTDRQQFLQLYREYRKNWPAQPTRPLKLAEQLPAHEFHITRINRWFLMANDAEADASLRGETAVLNPKDFLPRWSKAQEFIWNEFQDRPMIWCHGHFKPHELYRIANSESVYLTDFAHTKMYPEGHELAFMIWADQLVYGDWRQPYKKWKAGVGEWLQDIEPIAQEFGYGNDSNFMAANLAERILGTILADVTASPRRPREEKLARLGHLYQLLDDLL